MNAVCPAIAKLLLQLSAGKVEPPFVEKGAELVWARQPDHHRRRVGHDAKTSLAFQELFLCTFAQCDVARHPPCEGRFAMFVQLDAAMTRHPACASVRPRDAIFVLILAATALKHLLHKLLRTFAILWVHNLKHSVKAHWLRLREAEYPPPLVRYPKFVILDVPKPQTKVRRVGREGDARLALAQFTLTLLQLPRQLRRPHHVKSQRAAEYDDDTNIDERGYVRHLENAEVDHPCHDDCYERTTNDPNA